jgi:small subunit ribosomal protein S6
MSNITHYELTTIINPNIPDNELSEIIEKVKGLITDNKGEITSEENLGRKKLSYPIEKLLKGVFICLEFNLEPKTLKAIEKELKLDKTIIRYLVVKKPENVKVIDMEEVKKAKSKDSTPAKDKVEEKKEKEIKEEAPEEEKKEDKDAGKKDLKDLDKKLDEILNDDIIN